jgi:hypothetical protein
MAGRAGVSRWLDGPGPIGDAYFRVLGYSFALRWNAEELGIPATKVLAPFRAPPDPDDEEGSPLACSAPYSLLLGPGEPAAFRVFHGDAVLIEGAEANAVLPYFFWHVGLQAARRTGSYLLVHAGAVSSPFGDGLVLPGSSGAGKTTLVAALVRAGFGYLSDETAPLDPVSRRRGRRPGRRVG